MSDAVPALARGLINSVIAPFGNPPPTAWSRKGNPIRKRVAAAAPGCRGGETLLQQFPKIDDLADCSHQRKMAGRRYMFKRTFNYDNDYGRLTLQQFAQPLS